MGPSFDRVSRTAMDRAWTRIYFHIDTTMGIHDKVVSSGFHTLSVNSSHPRSVPLIGVRTRTDKLGFLISTVVVM
jgi:hypothetical protein